MPGRTEVLESPNATFLYNGARDRVVGAYKRVQDIRRALLNLIQIGDEHGAVKDPTESYDIAESFDHAGDQGQYNMDQYGTKVAWTDMRPDRNIPDEPTGEPTIVTLADLINDEDWEAIAAIVGANRPTGFVKQGDLLQSRLTRGEKESLSEAGVDPVHFGDGPNQYRYRL